MRTSEVPTGWEERQLERFGEEHLHVWQSRFKTPVSEIPYERVAYVEEPALCAFLGLTPAHVRRMIGKALTYRNLSPDTVTFTVPTNGLLDDMAHTALIAAQVTAVLYRWEAIDAILSVPNLVAKRHQVKLSAIMKRLYEWDHPGRYYANRFETEEECYTRLRAEYDVERQKHAQETQRFIARMERKQPGWTAAMNRLGAEARSIHDDLMALYHSLPDNTGQDETAKPQVLLPA